MDELKDRAKAVLKIFGKKIIKTLLPIVLVIVLVASFVYYINVWVDASDDDEDWSSPIYATGQYTSNVTMSNNGKITSPMTAQELWDKMMEEGNRVNLYLDGPEQLLKLMNAETITQFLDTRDEGHINEDIDWDSINSDVNSNDLQGIIKLKRSDSEGNIYTMTYVDESTFQSYINEYNSNGSQDAKEKALKHFTLGSNTTTESTDDGESSTTEYYAKVATWTEKQEEVKNENISEKNGDPDPDVEQYTNYEYCMTTKDINYQDLVKGYTMPFDYLWQLLVISEDKDFVLELADLVYNSKIEITVYDNLTTNTNVYVDTYSKNEKIETTATAKAEAISWKTDTIIYSDGKTKKWEDEESKEYKTTHTTINKENTLEISVTLADIWFAKYQQDYTNEIPQDVVTGNGEDGENLDDIPYENTPSETTNNDSYGYDHDVELEKEVINNVKKYLNDNGYKFRNVITENDISLNDYIENKFYKINSTVTVKEEIYRYSYTKRNEKITNTLKENTYVASPLRAEEKVDKNSNEPNFVTIFLDSNNSKARNNILEVESWLFELIENNKDTATANLLYLTKYLLYRATGKDYGVTDFDCNALYTSELKNVGIGDYIVHIDKSSDKIVITDVETLKTAFSGYSSSKKLIEYADIFLDFQETYRVNAVFAAAVSISETTAGTRGHAADGKNNWFNIECHCGDASHGRFESYESAEESIERFFKLIANGSYYFTKGNFTVSKIGMIYCENADQPGGWIENTNAFMKQMFEAAGIVYSAVEGGITTEEERVELESYIQNELIHTQYHYRNSAYQEGPFAKWWSMPNNVLTKFQCTWWANGRASMYLEEHGTKYTKYPTQRGNGGEYYDINKSNGWFNYGNTPKPNSLVSWSNGGSYGHVAYVEGVISEDEIYISHAGGGKSWFGVKLENPKTLWGYTLKGYIYLDEPIQ